MKKQFLLLMVAFMASLTVAWAQPYQLSPGVTATQPIAPLTCVANANFLHPVAGVSYTYEMTGTGTNQWTWFATKNPAFITNGTLLQTDRLAVAAGQLVQTSANYGFAGATNSVSITWTPEILANTLYQGPPSTTVFPSPTFVVGYATGTACADNIKVYEINPIRNFTIDIANVNPVTRATMDWDALAEQCVDKTQGATYTAGNLLMDYGKDTLYFEVAAANFVKNFTPVFQVMGGMTDPQTAVISLHASLALAEAGTLVAPTATATIPVGTPWATALPFTATDAAQVAAGVSLFVRVIITNSTFESLLSQDFVLAVDARDNDNAGIWDMEDADCTPPIADAADQIDRATHKINPRPTIIGDDDTLENPAAPNNIVPKNP
jgi:hypothetical protein